MSSACNEFHMCLKLLKMAVKLTWLVCSNSCVFFISRWTLASGITAIIETSIEQHEWHSCLLIVQYFISAPNTWQAGAKPETKLMNVSFVAGSEASPHRRPRTLAHVALDIVL